MINITKFKTEPFIIALKDFFKELSIPINYLADEPANAATILDDKYKPDNDAHKLINEVYALGLVNNDAFKEKGLFEDEETFVDIKSIKKNIKKDYDGLLLFGVTLKSRAGDLLPTRGQLAEITRSFNRAFPYTPVTIIFKYDAYITFANSERIPYKINKEGEKAGKVTMLKDVFIEKPHAAHERILLELKINYEINTFDALYKYWQKILDTKELNKQFFQELANWYFWATQKVTFPNDEDANKDILNATSVIRLITRIMFVWFVKEKNLVSDDLFDKKKLEKILKFTDKKGSTYYKAILQNLFFATLNTEMGKRKFRATTDNGRDAHFFIHNLFRYHNEFINPDETIETYFANVPFLNGGLFECLDKEIEEDGKLKRIRIDGFSDRTDNVLTVPDELFFSDKEQIIDLSTVYGTPKKSKEKVRGLIDILNNYKFTITENTPIEEEVALDPELLGKVFENLLANYNPETQTTARKQTGSFYTPREIVNYMVDESLIAYLKSTVSFLAEGRTVNILVDGEESNSRDDVGTLPTDGEESNIRDDVGTFPTDKEENNSKDAVGTYFDPRNEIEIHQGNLPHWQQENVWYFITFRLADSIPANVAEEIKLERELWLKKHQKGKDVNFTKEEIKEYYHLFSDRVEKLLNAGMGSCVLKDKKIAKIIADALLYFNNQRYILDEWVVMPNHVHILVKPLGEHKLPDILHSWKSFTANEINKVLGKKGQLWLHESYDHIVRNEHALKAIRNYIRQNPVKAGIEVTEASMLQIVSESRDNNVPEASMLQIVSESRDNNVPEASMLQIESGSRDNNVPEASLLPVISGSRDASGTLEQHLRNLLSYSEKEVPFTAAEKEKLIHAIDTIKILDPACGSGAFPMGILHKLVHVLHKLDPKNELWKQRQIEKASAIDDAPSREAAIEAIEEAFENNELDYGRKLYLIENCIFGVDIQPVAVQISKLRFFISLIVEQKVFPASSGKKNLGVLPLPNLETKFVAANTLIALEKENANLFTNPEIDKAKEQLKKIRHDYFEARTPKRKENCRAKDKELRNRLAELLVTNHDLQPATAKKVATWNPYNQNASAPFFDMEWMFGFNDGFDVVIGNPPYVSYYSGQAATISEKDYQIYLNHYDFIENKNAKNRLGTVMMFLEKAYKFISPSSITTYIIDVNIFSDAFIPIRKYLSDKISINFIVSNLSEFENVGSGQILFSFKKGYSKSNNFKYHKCFSDVEPLLINQSKSNKENNYVYRFGLNESIISKINLDSLPLNDVSYIISGMNIGGVKDYFLSEIRVDKTCHKAILSGNVFRYEIDYPNEVQRNDPRKNFIKFDKQLEKYIFENKLGTPSIGTNDDRFKKEKILLRRPLTGDGKLAAAYSDDKDHYSDVTVYIINETLISLKLLLGLLNSKLATFYCKETGIIRFEKGQQPQITINRFKEFPVSNKLQEFSHFQELVDKILSAKEENPQADTGALEMQIDIMVYKLYQLTYEEVLVIDKDFSNQLSKEEYDAL